MTEPVNDWPLAIITTTQLGAYPSRNPLLSSVVRWTITSSMGVYVAAHWLAFGSEVKLSADYALENTVGAIGSLAAPMHLVLNQCPGPLRGLSSLTLPDNNSCSPRGAAVGLRLGGTG